jgi:hypothetical protein
MFTFADAGIRRHDEWRRRTDTLADDDGTCSGSRARCGHLADKTSASPGIENLTGGAGTDTFTFARGCTDGAIDAPAVWTN